MNDKSKLLQENRLSTVQNLHVFKFMMKRLAKIENTFTRELWPSKKQKIL